MLRSFQYAAYVALFEEVAAGVIVAGGAAGAGELGAVLGAVGLGGLPPGLSPSGCGGRGSCRRRAAEREILLDAFLLEKAIYELGYELNNRPGLGADPAAAASARSWTGEEVKRVWRTNAKTCSSLARSYGVQTSYQDALGEPRRGGARIPARRRCRRCRRPSSRFARRAGGAEGAARGARAAAGRAGRGRLGRPRAGDRAAPGRRARLAWPITSTSRAASGGPRWRTSRACRRRRPAAGSPHPGRLLALPEPLPFGYHRLTVELDGRTAESLVISAPTRCFCGRGKRQAALGRLPAALRPAHRAELGGRRLLGPRDARRVDGEPRRRRGGRRCRCSPPSSTSRSSPARTRRRRGCSGTSSTSIPAACRRWRTARPPGG